MITYKTLISYIKLLNYILNFVFLKEIEPK